MTIGELIFNVGFKADTMKLKDFGKAVSELNLTSILAAGSFGAVYEGAKALVGIADDMSLGINKFGRETGQSREEIQKWNRVAEQMGVSAGVVSGSVAGLEDSIFKMRFTGEGANIWNMLGLDPRKTSDMFQVLTMLRNKLKDMSTEQQRFFLERLGISTEMLNMFKMTDAQWTDIGKQMTLSNDQLDQMQDYHKSLVQDGENLKLIFADLGVALEPVFKAFINILNTFDMIVLKSWEFKGLLDSIAEIASAIAKDMQYIFHPMSIVKDVGSTLNTSSAQLRSAGTDMTRDMQHPERPYSIQSFLDGLNPFSHLGDLFSLANNPIPSSSSDGSQGTKLTVTNKIYTSDANTTVVTSTDEDKTDVEHRRIINQLSPPST